MKKLFLMLIALIMGFSGAWADGLLVSTTESANAEYQYKIFCRNANTYYLGNTTNATNSGVDYGLFAFYSATADGYTNGYYIYSVFNGKWLSYEAKDSYADGDRGKNKITLVDTKAEANPWHISADNDDNKYYDIRAFQTDKDVDASGKAAWNWHGGVAANTSNTMGWYDYNDGNSGWGLVLAGGSGSPIADRKVVAIYNRTPNDNEYPITSAVNGSGQVLSSNSTSATPQLFVLRQNGIDSNGEAMYQLQKAEADGKYFSNDGTTPQNNTYSTTSSNFVFLNTSSYFIDNYSAILKDGTTIATSNYNLMARATYYGCIHSKNNNAKFDGWTSNENSSNKIQFYYADNDWNGLWSVKEQNYTAWQVVIMGASGSITYTGSNLLSGATTLQSNNGIFVLNATPTASNFTPTFVDGYLSDPTITIDSDRKLIKVAYTSYSEIYNTITTTLDNAPEGVGYPTMTARAKLQTAIDAFEASKTTANLAALSTQYNSFLTSVALPELGKVYTIQNYIKSPSKTTYLKNVNGTLTIGTEADATALNNLWIVRKSGSNNIVLQSAADLSKYIVYTSFALAATGSNWSLSQGTEWPYISMYNGTLSRFVASNGSDRFGTANGNYYANARTQASGWSTDFKFVENTDYALYKVKIIYPQGSSPTVTYNETAYSNGGEFLAATGLTTASLSVSEVSGYTPSISIDDDIIYVTYEMTLNQTYADTWNFDTYPWAVLQEVPTSLPTGRTYRYNTKRLHITTNCNSTVAVEFVYSTGNYRIDVGGVDLIDPSTGEVVKAEYHDGYSGTYQSNREYVITDVAPGDYILRYMSYSQSTSSAGNISIKITPATGFYRIKNNGTNNYLAYGQSYASSLSVPRDIGLIATSTSNDAASVFRLTGSNGTYKLSVQGLNIQSQTTGNKVFPGTEDTGKDFAFNISSSGVVSITNSDSRVNDNLDGSLHEATDGWTVHGVVNWNASAGNSKWVIEKATSVSLSLNAGGDGYYYATLCLPFDVELPEGTSAYTLTFDDSKRVLTLSDAISEVPAGTPVFLRGESGSISATIGTGYSADPLTTTSLTGVYVDTDVSANTDFFLGKYGGKVGFYTWDGTTLKANRAYLPAATVTGSGVKGFAIDWDLETAINAIDNEKLTIDNGSIYNLAGQRVLKAQKGIFVKNGRKVVVK